MKYELKHWVWLLSLLWCCWGFADSPATLLQGVANHMISELEKNKSQLKSDPAVIHRIVDSVLLPYIDINRMAGMVVGRQAWNAATPAQRREFVTLFKRRVVNTYANALASYDDDKVVVYPLRGREANERFVSVSSAIIRKSGQKIGISYKLLRVENRWKVYDFSIEGISIVSNYHSQFANALANGGIANLNKQLVSR
ncbi:MAG: hypothetical protein A3F41_04305 [Coxiella sp. RIFCSPHIGHO2_12_FULL_44_14]|nr:MAG: hypothetical protein A3F41_04305 [Coxiella sp. RIFCSPHIGHO2_12_FULL_44_14]